MSEDAIERRTKLNENEISRAMLAAEREEDQAAKRLRMINSQVGWTVAERHNEISFNGKLGIFQWQIGYRSMANENRSCMVLGCQWTGGWVGIASTTWQSWQSRCSGCGCG